MRKTPRATCLRISWERSTPEGWEEAIKRMVRLNGLTITPGRSAVDRQVSRDLSRLAPEEAKPVMYYRRASHSGRDQYPERQRADRLHGLPCDGAPAVVAPLEGRLEAADEFARRAVRAGRSSVPLGLNAGGFGRRRATDAAIPAAPQPVDEALAYSRQDGSAAHAGMGGVAGSHAGAEARRTLAGFGAHSRARENISAKCESSPAQPKTSSPRA